MGKIFENGLVVRCFFFEVNDGVIGWGIDLVYYLDLMWFCFVIFLVDVNGVNLYWVGGVG